MKHILGTYYSIHLRQYFLNINVYFPEKNALYLHPGKTAGTSVTKSFYPDPINASIRCPERLFGWDSKRGIYLQHATMDTARECLGESIFTAAYRFVTVRNPFSRLLSVYYYNKKVNDERFGDFQRMVLALPELMATSSCLQGNHFTPQISYVRTTDNLRCHRILRFEAIATDFKKLTEELGGPAKLPQLNSTQNPEYQPSSLRSSYDDAMMETVRHCYADDFVELKYPLELF